MIAAHRAAIRNETMVSVAINALVPTAIIWMLDVTPPLALTGDHGMLPGLFMACGLATLLMTIVVTLLVRGRVRAGHVRLLDRAGLAGPLRLLPDALALRAPAMAVAAIVVLVPLAAATASLLGLLPITKLGHALFNLALGSVVGLTMTPLVVLRALADSL